MLEINTEQILDLGLDRTTWMLLSDSEEFMAVAAPLGEPEVPGDPVVVWTDAFSSLLAVIKPR